MSNIQEHARTAEQMRKYNQQVVKESNHSVNALAPINTGNYLSKERLESLSSVKKDKADFDKVIAKILMDIMLNADDDRVKMQAIDRYYKLTQNSQLLIKSGDKKVALESDSSSVFNIDLSSHVKSDEPIEDFSKTTQRDVVRETSHSYEDADFEVIPN